MGIRIFSINRDGSYREVSPSKESLLDGNGAYLLVDRKEKNIYIYRKDGIPSVLAYSAGRAATNLKTKKGSKYRIINIEQEERDRILPQLIKQLEQTASSEVSYVEKKVLPRQAYIYGEKTVAARQTIEPVEQPITPQTAIFIEEKEATVTQETELTKSYEFEDVVKTLASKILFDSNIDNMKDMNKPPRHQLRGKLIKKVDELLDNIY